MNKSNIFLTISLLFLGGVLVGSSLSMGVLIGIGALISVVTIAVFRRGSVVFVVLFVLAFGAGILMIQKAETEKAVLEEFDGSEVTLRGYVFDDPYVIDARQYFDLKVKEIVVSGYLLEVSDEARVTTEIYPEYEFGDTLELKGHLEERRVYRPEVSEIDFDKPFYTFLYRKIFDLKNVFSDSVDRSVLEPNASFINGILLGERSAIPLSLKEAFRRTGMVHILAISGYNVTIIVSLIYALLLLILRRSKAFWFALLGIFAFTVLTGASASVVRAAIMGSLVILAHKEGRIYSSSRALAFTAALMVAFDPLVIQEDIGFLLSFAATLGMLYLVPVFDKYVRRIPGFYGTKEAAVTTLSAQIMVLPLLLYFFGSVSPLSVVVNIMVLPLIPLAMLLGFVVGLVGIVSLNLAIILGYLPWLVTTVQIKIIEFFGKFEMWDFSFNLALMIFVYGLILYILIRNGELT